MIGQRSTSGAKRAVHKAFGNAMREMANTRRPPINKALALTEQVGALGGYLVPLEVKLEILEGVRERCLFREMAWNFEMDSSLLRIPTVDLTAAHAVGASPLFGGLQPTWVTEGTAVPESQPSFATADLIARTLTCRCKVQNQLKDDANAKTEYLPAGEALGKYLINLFEASLAWGVEQACFVGTGVSQPLGIVNAKATVRVQRLSAGSISLGDVANMVASLLPGSFVGCVWACSVTALQKIVTFPTFTAVADKDDPALCGILQGRRLYATEHLPALGGTGDLVLFDPRAYVLGTRQMEIVIATESPVAFPSNQTDYMLVWRGDGTPLFRNTITLQDGTTTVGASVALSATMAA